jgi:hypothetical protein
MIRYDGSSTPLSTLIVASSIFMFVKLRNATAANRPLLPHSLHPQRRWRMW